MSVVPFAVFPDTKRLETQRRIDKNMQYMTEDIYKPSFHNDVSNFMSVYKIFIQYLLVSSEVHLVKYLFFFIFFLRKT